MKPRAVLPVLPGTWPVPSVQASALGSCPPYRHVVAVSALGPGIRETTSPYLLLQCLVGLVVAILFYYQAWLLVSYCA